MSRLNGKAAQRLGAIWPDQFGENVRTRSGRPWAELVVAAVIGSDDSDDPRGQHTLDNDQVDNILAAVQFAREQLEVQFEDGDMPPRLMRAHERLEEAAITILNS